MTDETRKKVVLLNINWDAPAEDVKELAESLDVVVHEFIYPPANRNGYQGRGYCFYIVDEQSVETLIRELDGKSFMGRVLRCEIAERQEGTRPPKPWRD